MELLSSNKKKESIFIMSGFELDHFLSDILLFWGCPSLCSGRSPLGLASLLGPAALRALVWPNGHPAGQLSLRALCALSPKAWPKSRGKHGIGFGYAAAKQLPQEKDGDRQKHGRPLQ